MKLSDFSFDLPNSLIASYPCYNRSACRLLVINGNNGFIHHTYFFKIINEINSNDLIIFNDTQVIPARIFGYKENGGKLEILVERILNNNTILARIRASRNIKVGSLIFLGKYKKIKSLITERKDLFFTIVFYNNDYSSIDIINDIGEIPLPPYIKRTVNYLDSELYQTVYKKNVGSIAAPTAGLHFDAHLLNALDKKGVNIGYITLHIGSSTFQPVRENNIKQHIMHSELVEVSSNLMKKIKYCKENGGRVIAVGTTTLRALESAYNSSAWKKMNNFISDTNIFIYPGYQHNIVDGLITNFHLPKSTLIMLVASFLGYKNTKRAYYEAIRKRYRFFSYGDAMYITYNILAPYERIIY